MPEYEYVARRELCDHSWFGTANFNLSPGTKVKVCRGKWKGKQAVVYEKNHDFYKLKAEDWHFISASCVGDNCEGGCVNGRQLKVIGLWTGSYSFDR